MVVMVVWVIVTYLLQPNVPWNMLILYAKTNQNLAVLDSERNGVSQLVSPGKHIKYFKNLRVYVHVGVYLHVYNLDHFLKQLKLLIKTKSLLPLKKCFCYLK